MRTYTQPAMGGGSTVVTVRRWASTAELDGRPVRLPSGPYGRFVKAETIIREALEIAAADVGLPGEIRHPDVVRHYFNLGGLEAFRARVKVARKAQGGRAAAPGPVAPTDGLTALRAAQTARAKAERALRAADAALRAALAGAVASGARPAEAARLLGVSRQRVHQLLAEAS